VSGIEEYILEYASERADEVEIFSMDETLGLIGFENNRLKSIEQLENVGIALRLIKNGKLGEGYATDLTQAGAKELVDRVSDLAVLGGPVPFRVAAGADYPEIDLADPAVEAIPDEDQVALGQRLLTGIRARLPHVLAHITFAKTRTGVRVLTSRGADASFTRMVASSGIGLELIEGKSVIQMSAADRGLHPSDRFEETVDTAVKDMEIARNHASITPGKHKVIFAPDTLGDVFMAFMDGINGRLVAKGLSPLTGRIGDRILNEKITITDDNLHPEGLFSSPMDDEGTPGQRTVIIENGVLRNYLHDLRSSAELDMAPTGNGFRSLPLELTRHYRTPATVDPSNLFLEPGDTPYENMLKDVDLGIEIRHITGILLGNLTNGDFSGNLELAYLIENGKRVGRIRDTMVFGNFYKVFNENLLAVGDATACTGLFAGSSGSMYIPHLYCRDIELSGKS